MDWPLVDCYCCSNHTHWGTQAYGGMSAPTTVPRGCLLLHKDSGRNLQWCNWARITKIFKTVTLLKKKNHSSGKLQLCGFVLSSLASVHQTQPSETVACQVYVIILTSLFQSKMALLLSAASKSSEWATFGPFQQALNWHQHAENI